MPYALGLQQYLPPGYDRPFPESWAKRLREMSPTLGNLAHLHPRWVEPKPEWYHPERGVWLLYSCTPRHMVHPDRVEQMQLHWSELDSTRQVGRREMVSSYQHYMWHVHGVEAQPFWILQGDWGGTPAKYSQRERRYLDASNAISEPFPIGFFPPTPFTERSVALILERDRLVKACNRYDELEKMDRPEYLKAEDEAAERLFRETYIDTWKEIMRPSVEFIASTLGKSQYNEALPPAPEGLSDTVSQWKDHFIEHGAVIGTHIANHRKLQVAVA